jgi:hypothetical protein
MKKTANLSMLSKSIAMLVGLVVLSTSFAQTVSTGPNKVYIEQIGDASNIILNQTGQSNRIGTTDQTRLLLQGNNQTVTVTQTGNQNTVEGQIKTADNVDSTITQTGDQNTVTLDQGDSVSVAGSTQTITVTGNLNTATLTQGNTSSSTDAVQTIAITGDQNAYTSVINADDVVNSVAVVGDSNTVSMLQNGHSGKNVELNVTGNSNTHTIQQKSTLNVDTLKINTTGNSSTVAVTQCNPGGC